MGLLGGSTREGARSSEAAPRNAIDFFLLTNWPAFATVFQN